MALQRLSALALVSFFFIYLLKVGEVYSLGFVPSIVAFAATVGFLLLSYSFVYKKHLIDLLVVFYTIALTFSAIYAPDTTTALRYLAQIIIYSVVPYLLLRSLDIEENLVTRFRLYALLSFFPLCFWIYVSLGATGLFHNFRLGNNDFNPVAVGYLLGFFVLAVFFELKSRSLSTLKRFGYILLFLIILFLLTLTGSRGPLISVILICIMSTILSKFSFIRLLSALCIISSIGLVFFRLFSDTDFFSRFTNPLKSASALERFQEWSYALKYFELNPFVGLGLGGFDINYGNYPHNVFLEHASNMGVMGLLPYTFLALLSVLFFIYENCISKSLELRFLASGLLYAFSVRLLSLNMANSKEIFLFLAIYITLSIKTKP